MKKIIFITALLFAFNSNAQAKKQYRSAKRGNI